MLVMFNENNIQFSVVTNQGTKIGNYIITKLLGEGKYGRVFKAINIITNQEFAIKMVEKSKVVENPILDKLFHTEVAIMHSIQHPNILHLYEFLETGNNYYLVVDYCEQGDIESYLKARKIGWLEESEAVGVLKQIANGFQELRKHKILHRDFKMSNTLVKDGLIVIGDFGFAKSGAEIAETRLGTPVTMAYEIMVLESDKPTYNSKADLWSIGVVYYELLFGEPPFVGMQITDMIKDINKKANGNMKYPKKVSKESRDLLDRIFVTNPEQRIDWTSFFNHSLFEKYGLNLSKTGKSKIGSLSNMMASNQERIESEFRKNKQHKKNDGTFEFLDQDCLLEYGDRHKLNPYKTQESSYSKSSQFKLDSAKALQAVGDKYSHERNKILFMIYTSSKVHQMVIDGLYSSLMPELYNLALVLLKKASVLNDYNILYLQRKNNIYNIVKKLFADFLKSQMCLQIRQRYEANQDKLKVFTNMILSDMNQKNMQIQNSDVLTAEFPDLNQLDNLLFEMLTNLVNHHQNREFDQTDTEREYLQVLASVKYCIECEEHFPFIEKNNDKFDWTTFYTTLENSPTSELSKIIYK